ncbi:MAG: DUF87 domain-containing protein [Candidatus Roizmanbacteria bacterium]|nr:DUF87 domain-containing protein [Candidatus Roizmanbacteria bacterium]
MDSFFKKIKHFIQNRFILFGIFLIVFILIQYCFYGTLLPSTETKDLWFYSGIFMVLFSILFIDPYYTSPKNVITNTIPLLLVFLAIKNSFSNILFWWVALVLLLLILIASITALALADKENSELHWKNKLALKLKNIVVIIGQGRFLYSAVFLYFLLSYYTIQNIYTVLQFIIWFFILSINPKKLHASFSSSNMRIKSDQIGEIFGVQSKKIFLVKLFGDKNSIQKFDIVEFRYSMQDINDSVISGIVFDTYLLNQEKWAKVLQLDISKNNEKKLDKNIVYKLKDNPERDKKLKINDLVGVVIEGSTIGKIKFEYSKKSDDLQEGDLLELNVGDKRLFYQVIGCSTEKEKLEARNETGFIEGEAIQLGEWQEEMLSFQKFGWVPSINTPIFKANTSDINIPTLTYPLYKLGVIPNTSLPSVINLKDAISHHIALLGITGSGKSFITQKIIGNLAHDTRIICIDFTGEWKKKFSATEFKLINKDNIVAYLAERNSKVGIFELPALSNTTDVLKETQQFLENLFNYAKNQYDANSPIKAALVLEEAHTITPETSFLGEMGDYSSNKALVNKMTQVALQGRKYGVGLLVIAQRTANVSKTVLTQCNTVICFQAFDETSFSFLGNYVGKDMVQTLPNLKKYHAVVAGKGMKANMPMIVDLTR